MLGLITIAEMAVIAAWTVGLFVYGIQPIEMYPIEAVVLFKVCSVLTILFMLYFIRRARE